MAYPKVPHFEYPFHFHEHHHEVGVSAHVVEQDSMDDIISCVQVIVNTPKGTFIDDPEFGIVDQTFTTKPDYDGIMNDVVRSEPRVELLSDYDASSAEEFVYRVLLRATGSPASEARGARDPYA